MLLALGNKLQSLLGRVGARQAVGWAVTVWVRLHPRGGICSVLREIVVMRM